ncbi:hypothetical protein A7U60_g3716 [Sanghuangporus baumii]|uniref:Glyoxylate reductase n=1 Tax=Sanghuangporus baumii TaxID=108892 RepID=A0A9Q5N6F4_SANBA|nr:hypothetical protein A7U60_g3716 [Sanghuangporus baumii]
MSSPSARLAAIKNHLDQGKLLRRTKMRKVIVCRDLGTDAMGILRACEDIELVVWPENRPCDRTWLLDNVTGAEGVALMLSEKVDDELLDKAGPSLKVISTMSVGYEHVSLPALMKRGVRLGYTPDVLTDAVADVAVLLALMATRNVKATTSIVENGQWPESTWAPFSFCGPQLSSGLLPSLAFPAPGTPGTSSNPSGESTERTVGFLGFGRIAQATLARLVAFGARKFIYTGNPNASASSLQSSSAADIELATKHNLPQNAITRVSIESLAENSDVLFVLAPGGPSTYHIISHELLARMKPTAVLVNASRGSLVDSDALAQALGEGRLWGAGLDVVEGEPKVSSDHPLVKEPRCVILPHIGSATFETRRAMATLTARNVIAGVRGEPMPAELDLTAWT